MPRAELGRTIYGQVAKWLNALDCKSNTLGFGSSNLSLPTIHIGVWRSGNADGFEPFTRRFNPCHPSLSQQRNNGFKESHASIVSSRKKTRKTAKHLVNHCGGTRGSIAQSAERMAVNHQVVGSSPSTPAIWGFSSVWESACFASRRSADRPR